MKSASIVSLLAAATMTAAPLAAEAQDAAPAAASAPDVYKPAGQWSVDYGDDYCRLAHNFSDGSDTLALAVERIEPGPSARLILVSNAIKPFRSAKQIGWHFTPSDPEREAFYTHAPTADGNEYFNLGEFTLAPEKVIKVEVRDFSGQFPSPRPPSAPGAPPPYDRAAEQAMAKAFTGFVLDSGVSTRVQVDTGDLSAPMAALQACADDLAKSWGLDPAKLQSEKSRAVPDSGGAGWLPQGMIAFGDVAKLTGGSNQVRLMVDAAGKPTACAVHWATLDAATNDRICKALMDKAAFTPAKDANGQPMPGYWIGSPMAMGPAMKGPFGGR